MRGVGSHREDRGASEGSLFISLLSSTLRGLTPSNGRDIIPNNLPSLLWQHPAKSDWDALSDQVSDCVSFIYLFIHCYEAVLNRFNRLGAFESLGFYVRLAWLLQCHSLPNRSIW